MWGFALQHDVKEKKTKRKEKTTSLGVNLMRSQLFYQAAQVNMMYLMDEGLKKSSSIPDG